MFGLITGFSALTSDITQLIGLRSTALVYFKALHVAYR